MRMQFAKDVADDGCRFAGLGSGIQPQFVHGIQNAALYRLLPVTDIGKCATLDDGYRIIQIGALGKTGEHQAFFMFIIRR